MILGFLIGCAVASALTVGVASVAFIIPVVLASLFVLFIALERGTGLYMNHLEPYKSAQLPPKPSPIKPSAPELPARKPAAAEWEKNDINIKLICLPNLSLDNDALNTLGSILENATSLMKRNNVYHEMMPLFMDHMGIKIGTDARCPLYLDLESDDQVGKLTLKAQNFTKERLLKLASPQKDDRTQEPTSYTVEEDGVTPLATQGNQKESSETFFAPDGHASTGVRRKEGVLGFHSTLSPIPSLPGSMTSATVSQGEAAGLPSKDDRAGLRL